MGWLTNGGTLTEPIPVAYTEKETYPIVKGGPPTGSVVLRCKWDERHAVLANIVLNHRMWPYADGVPMAPVTGEISPVPNIRATAENGINIYPEALVTVSFEGQAPEDDGDSGPGGDDPSKGGETYSESLAPSAEMIRLAPYKGKTKEAVYQWGTGATIGNELTEEESPSKIVSGLDWVIRWTGLNRIPKETHTLHGYVNTNTIKSVTYDLSFAPETLLLSASNIGVSKSIETVQGKPKIVTKKTLELHFSYRAHTWNQFWRPETGQYEPIYRTSDKAKVYVYLKRSFRPLLPMIINNNT